jgi:hypothetical protein
MFSFAMKSMLTHPSRIRSNRAWSPGAAADEEDERFGNPGRLPDDRVAVDAIGIAALAGAERLGPPPRRDQADHDRRWSEERGRRLKNFLFSHLFQYLDRRFFCRIYAYATR